MEEQKLPEEEVLSKEEANQAASELIEGFKKVLIGTREFTDALGNKFFKDGTTATMDWRIGIDLYRTEIDFTTGDSRYKIKYQPRNSLRPDKPLSKDSIFNYIDMHSLRIRRDNRDIIEEVVSLSSVASVDIWNGKPKAMPSNDRYEFIVYKGKGQTRITNSPLAVQKAREMLAGLSSQQ